MTVTVVGCVGDSQNHFSLLPPFVRSILLVSFLCSVAYLYSTPLHPTTVATATVVQLFLRHARQTTNKQPTNQQRTRKSAIMQRRNIHTLVALVTTLLLLTCTLTLGAAASHSPSSPSPTTFLQLRAALQQTTGGTAGTTGQASQSINVAVHAEMTDPITKCVNTKRYAPTDEMSTSATGQDECTISC